MPRQFLFGNRSAALHSLGKHEEALADAEEAIRLNPGWAKGYHRKGVALISLERPREAAVAYATANEVERPAPGWVKTQLDLCSRLVEEASAKEPITTVDGWISVFRSISDQRKRLACFATFWNLAGQESRFAIFSAFFDFVAPKGKSEILAKYTVDMMRPLPMDNYEDVTLPKTWVEFYAGCVGATEQQVAIFQQMWSSCTRAEHELIIKDITFFFDPAGSAESHKATLAGSSDEAAATAGSGKRRSRRKRGARAGHSTADATASAAPKDGDDDVGAGGGAPIR